MTEITDITGKKFEKMLDVNMCLDFVMVQPIIEENKSVIALPDGVKSPEEPKQMSLVYATGPDCKNIKKGDVIMHNQMMYKGGAAYWIDDVGYIVLKEHDIYCVVNNA